MLWIWGTGVKKTLGEVQSIFIISDHVLWYDIQMHICEGLVIVKLHHLMVANELIS